MNRKFRFTGRSKFLLITGFIISLFILFRYFSHPPVKVLEKINGVNLVGMPYEINQEDLRPLQVNHVEWVALIPYAFSAKSRPEIHFNRERQWFGEKRAGIIQLATHARSLSLSIMIKPHLWVMGDGWPGDFEMSTDEQWLTWESSYEEYVLSYAALADSLHAEIYCLGTEIRHSVVQRPQFWKNLIKKVRRIYKGKITYAANWDNYHKISFWDKLDYIGIDAYFPLSDEKQPKVTTLKAGWDPIKIKLQEFSLKKGKPVLFTEYGYQSIDYATHGHWNINEDTLQANMANQVNAYTALYESLWQEDWMAGGFLWKWFPGDTDRGGKTDKNYTPQNKPTREIIKKWYGKNSGMPLRN